MLTLYRITLKKWSKDLSASGHAARWNFNGEFVLYTSESTSLACLENVVHRNGAGLDKDFCLMKLGVPKTMKITQLADSDLPKDWHLPDNYPSCRKIGSAWYRKGESAILKIPSAIIFNDFNHLWNTRHPDFKKVKILEVREFKFDERMKI